MNFPILDWDDENSLSPPFQCIYGTAFLDIVHNLLSFLKRDLLVESLSSLHDFENGKNFRLYTLKKISYFFKVFPFFCWRQFSTCTKWAGGVVSCSCMCHFMCAKCVSKGAAGNCSKTHSHHLSSCRTWENSAITIGGKDKEQNSGKYILKHTLDQNSIFVQKWSKWS